METQRGLRARRATFDAAFLLATILGSVALGGCGPDQVKAPNPTRSLDEGRAIEVIRRAIQNFESTGPEGRVNPAPGRDIKISNGTTIHIDVGIEKHEYGVAYISLDDAHKLGSSIPPPNKKDERLRLERGGDNGETRIVFLYQDNYLFDDLSGESHEQTTITAERELTRDVQDFIR